MKTTILALLVGALSGVIAALCGVGGGVIMVPAFQGLLNLSHKQAIATSLAVIVPTAILATWKNASGEAPLIQWWIVLPAALGAVITAWFGVEWMKAMSNQQLSRLFALLLIGVGVRLFFVSR